jgi:hypothetical protein
LKKKFVKENKKDGKRLNLKSFTNLNKETFSEFVINLKN